MKTIQLITKIIGLLIITSGVNSSFAEKIQVSTTFTCSTNAECKRKCEALGSDHTWKSNPGGATLGTCTKKRQNLTRINKLKLPPSAGVFVRNDIDNDSHKKSLSEHKLKLMKNNKLHKNVDK